MPIVKFKINNGCDREKLVKALFNAGYMLHKEKIPHNALNPLFGCDYYVCVDVDKGDINPKDKK